MFYSEYNVGELKSLASILTYNFYFIMLMG